MGLPAEVHTHTQAVGQCECTALLVHPDLCAFTCLCADIDECLTTVELCGEGDCLNTEGSYMCVCPKGYMDINGRTGCQGTAACCH